MYKCAVYTAVARFYYSTVSATAQPKSMCVLKLSGVARITKVKRWHAVRQ